MRACEAANDELWKETKGKQQGRRRPGAKSRVFQEAGGGQVEFSANRQKLKTDNRPFQSAVTPSRGREACRQKRGHETDRHAVVVPPRLHADLKRPAPFLNCDSETQEPSQDTYLS